MSAQRRLKLACTSALSNQSICCPLEETFTSLVIQNAPSEGTDQTVRMPWLILIFAGRICPKVRFLTLCITCFHRVIFFSALHLEITFSVKYPEYENRVTKSKMYN